MRSLSLPKRGCQRPADNNRPASNQEPSLTAISHIAPAAIQQAQTVRQAPVDADGDHDGSKAAKAPVVTQASKPTPTLGNSVNKFA
jgi:hypothetical protein